MKKSERIRILSKLDEMIHYIEELKDMLPGKDEYLQDLIRRRACEKTIEVAIESLIDVVAMIISSERLGLPTSEENMFDILVKRRILSKKLGEKLKDMKGFRNILIQRYGHVNDEIVYYNLSNYLKDFYDFRIFHSPLIPATSVAGYSGEMAKYYRNHIYFNGQTRTLDFCKRMCIQR